MLRSSVICPICGAKIIDAGSEQDFACPFCKFERRAAVGKWQEAPSSSDDMSLPFQNNLNDYFQEKFQQLKPGELWQLSLPVNRLYYKPAPLPGQINFFRAKNIMFLLEQHGFKMTWRQNRFSSTLRIIARKS